MSHANRSPEGIARHLAKSVARNRKKRECPEFRRKEADKAKERYHANKDKYREISLKWIAKNREKVNEKRRQWRRKNPELAKIRDKVYRGTTLTTAIRRTKRGEMGLDELNRRIDEALVRTHDRTRRQRPKSGDDSSGSR